MEKGVFEERQHTEGESKHSPKLISRLKTFFSFTNKCQRNNFILTCCIYFNFILLGWTYGQLGTVFQDLQLILGTNVEETSLLFTVNSVGYMAGSLTIGFIYDMVEPLRLLGIVSIINGVTSAVSPWCNIYWLFLFVRLIDGFLAGGRDGGGNAKIMYCWGNEGRSFMLALHFSYSIGGIISPLITRFFLAPKLVFDEINRNNSLTKFMNSSMNFSDIAVTPNETTVDSVKYGETKIQFAFLITGLLTAVSGMLYLILAFKGFYKVPTFIKPIEGKQNTSTLSNTTKRVGLQKYQVAVFTVLIALTVTSSTALECKAFSFTMPFVLLQLNWTKSNGAFLISLLWAFYSFGRVSGIVISRFKFFQPQRIILFSLLLIVISSCGLYIGSVYHITSLVWTMVPLMGVGVSCCFPTYIVWTHENVLKITGKVGGFFQFAGSLGCFLDPLYIGALMEKVSPLYFVYVQIGQCAFSMSVFIIILMWISSRRKTSCNIS